MPPSRNFPRGARPTPRHKMLATPPFQVVAAPPQMALVPKQLDMWGNDQYGDCVSAEEAFAKACDNPEDFIPAQTVTSWASQNGFLNGANLTDVMDVMRTNGFVVSGKTYTDGAYQGVDYSSDSVLQSAISTGPVKIAIDANALPSGAGNNQGWYAVGGGRYPNTDHCVALCGYGPAAWLYQQLGVPLPSAIASASGYLLYTWSTIGFVDHAWLQGTCVEAWIRNPTSLINGVPVPGPNPNPPTPPTPPVPPVPPTPGTGYTGTLTYTAGVLTAVSQPAPGPTPTPVDPWAAIWAAIVEIFANNPNGWSDLIKAILALFSGLKSNDAASWQTFQNNAIGLLRAAHDNPGIAPWLLQIVDLLITTVGNAIGIPAAILDVIIQVVNQLFGARAAADFAARHGKYRRLP